MHCLVCEADGAEPTYQLCWDCFWKHWPMQIPRTRYVRIELPDGYTEVLPESEYLCLCSGVAKILHCLENAEYIDCINSGPGEH